MTDLIARLRALTAQMQEDPAWPVLARWAIHIDRLLEDVLAEATPAPPPEPPAPTCGHPGAIIDRGLGQTRCSACGSVIPYCALPAPPASEGPDR